MTTSPAIGLLPPPPRPTGFGGRAPRPAPVASILAALARLASHAGDPRTLTITEPGHSIHVTLSDAVAYQVWQAHVGGEAIYSDGGAVCTLSRLHGWSITLTVAGELR